MKKKKWLCQKEDKCGEIAKGNFSKITETARLPGWEFAADKSWYGGYITSNFIDRQLLEFSKYDLLRFHRICLLFDKINFLYVRIKE